MTRRIEPRPAWHADLVDAVTKLATLTAGAALFAAGAIVGTSLPTEVRWCDPASCAVPAVSPPGSAP